MARKRKLLVPEAREAINRLMKDILLQKEQEPKPKQAPAPIQSKSAGQSTAARPPAGGMIEKLIRLAKQEQQKNDPSMRK